LTADGRAQIDAELPLSGQDPRKRRSVRIDLHPQTKHQNPRIPAQSASVSGSFGICFPAFRVANSFTNVEEAYRRIYFDNSMGSEDSEIIFCNPLLMRFTKSFLLNAASKRGVRLKL